MKLQTWLKKIILFYFIRLICVSNLSVVYAQKDSTTFKVPPLSKLVGAALENSNQLKSQQALIEYEKANMIVHKAGWQQRVFTDVVYSVGNNIVATDASSGGASSQSLITQFGNNYRVGLVARVSFSDIFGNRKYDLQGKAKIAATEYEYHAQTNELEERVTLLYYQLISLQELLEIKAETQYTLGLHRQIAEREFSQGQVQIAVLSSVVESHARAVTDFLQTKANYQSVRAALEILVGKPLSEL